MEISIKKIEVTDAAILSSIAKETFYDTFTGTCAEIDMQQFLDQYFNIEQIRSELEDTKSFNFFAEVENVPVGYIRFKEDYISFPYIEKWKAIELKRLYIKKEFYGKGVAKELMKIFMDYAAENKFEIAWLGVWEYNFRAQNFYKKYGFVDSGCKHDFPIGNTPQTDCWYWKFL